MNLYNNVWTHSNLFIFMVPSWSLRAGLCVRDAESWGGSDSRYPEALRRPVAIATFILLLLLMIIMMIMIIVMTMMIVITMLMLIMILITLSIPRVSPVRSWGQGAALNDFQRLRFFLRPDSGGLPAQLDFSSPLRRAASRVTVERYIYTYMHVYIYMYIYIYI